MESVTPILSTICFIAKNLFKLKRLRNYFKKRSIVVYGESGVGKSQFLNSLRGCLVFVEERTLDIKSICGSYLMVTELS